jgi:hypothetical protein
MGVSETYRGDAAARAPDLLRSGTLALVLAGLALVFYAALVLVLGPWRDLPGYHTETDFLGGAISEARRLLAGEPLESSFHPPGFTFVLAAVQSLVGEWFAAGKAIAMVSGAVALVATHRIFLKLCGPWVALGAVLGLLCSATFLRYAIQATTDVYFLALMSVTSLAAVSAALRPRPAAWFLAGMLVGLCFMTRTNGITQIVLLAAPLVLPGAMATRLRGLAAGLAGMAATIGAFLFFATVTGSNLMPAGTYHNLAMTYFSQERIAWDGVLEARARFDSLGAVLAHDPMAIVRGYLHDLFELVTQKTPRLSGPFLGLLFLPGLMLLAGDHARAPFLILLLATVAQVGLVNFKTFEARYYLFLMPWLGASAAWLAVRFARADWAWPMRLATVGVVVAFFAAGLVPATAWTVRDARPSNAELSEALPALQAAVTPRDAILARPPHVSFYTGATSVWMTAGENAPELETLLTDAAAETKGSVFLFYGRIERMRRPDLEALLADGARPAWLVEVARGAREPWALYRYAP